MILSLKIRKANVMITSKTLQQFCIIKEQMLFSGCALAVHEVLHLVINYITYYLAWTFSSLKCTI